MKDDTETAGRLARAARLRQYREEAGFRSASAAARAYRWVESTLRSHENGTRPIGDDDAERYAQRFSRPGRKITAQDIMYGPSDERADARELGITEVRVVGRVGAGAEILPELEQLPPEGLFEIEVPFPVPENTLAFEVEGDSMWPRYDPGDVVLCWREGTNPAEVIGWEAAVRTEDGKRYLKRIMAGGKPRLFDLESYNSPTIRGVRLQWISKVQAVVRAGEWRQIGRAARKRITRELEGR